MSSGIFLAKLAKLAELAERTGIAKPHKPSPPPPEGGMDPALPGLLGLGVAALIVALSFWLWYAADKKQRLGVGVLKRRHLRRHGLPAEANVLSVDIVDESMSAKYCWLRAIIYDVRPLGDHPPFRAKGVERMWSSEMAPNGVEVNRTVRVLFDPVDHTVLLVRRDPRDIERMREEQKRAREEALLRGPPGS